jgi:glycosyltransferase involved in cell wall biosynthesis
MRVLFCQTCAYLPADGGGALSNTDELCSALPARGVDVAVLSGLTQRSWSRLRSVIGRRRGGPDRSLGYPVYRAEDPLALAGHLAGEQRPDVAVVQLGDIAGLAHRFVAAGIPTLIYFHDPYSMPEPQSLPAHPLLGFAACSSALALQVARRLGVEVATAPVMIQPARYRTDSERRVVTFVNPIPRKGVEIAFALAARRPDIPFEFVESSQLRGRVVKLLQARAAHHGNVRLLRRRADMRSIYRRSRLLLAPSLWDEAWGRVVSEAQVSGIPALASDSGGLPEAVGPGGFIVERGAPEGRWLEALSRLWDDQAAYERYAAAAAAHAGRPEIQPEAALGRMLELITRQGAARGTPAS